ncbi:MAG: VOC family protein [Dongiaceae bacterium]
MQVQPYLCFDGACEQALDFYKRAIGAKVGMMMRFKEAPDPAACTPVNADKVMHCEFKIGDSTILASDGMKIGKPNFQGFSLSLTPANDAEAKRLFDALSDGGQVQMPMAKTFFASSFGMVADRFGISWMVYVPLPMER